MSKLLTVKERLKALADGKRIRMVYWDSDCRTNGVCFIQGKNETALSDLSRENIFAESVKWELYEEPKLEITAADVGRKVRRRDGSIAIIGEFRVKAEKFNVLVGEYTHTVEGRCHANIESGYDIIEFID